HVDLAAALDAHVLAHELPPEPTEVRPPEPLDGPAALPVARPRERPAEPGAPASEHRLAAIALEDELRGRRLELRRDVAVEQRRARDRDALQEIRRGDLRDGKPLLDGRLLRDDLRLAREDARQRVRVGRVVEAAAARVREPAQELAVDALADAHRAERDRLGDHRLREL